MKFFKKFALLVVAVAMCACASHKDLNLIKTNVMCRVGDEIVITLPSYESTDADWSIVSYSDNFLKVKSRKVKKSCPIFGAGDCTLISFKAIKEGKANVKLGYFKNGANVYTETQDFVIDVMYANLPELKSF